MRQDPYFPAALLVDKSGASTEAGYEVKAWYALSTELTGPFRESASLLANGNVKVAIVAWVMDHIVYGTPIILGVCTVDGKSVAECRDQHYHKPPDYLIVEPQATTDRTRNLQQTNVNGYKLQETRAERTLLARQFVDSNLQRKARTPHSHEAQEMARALMSQFTYRTDTNFGKMDRIEHPAIENFKRDILGMLFRERSITEWRAILSNASKQDDPEAQSSAIRAIQAIYDQMSFGVK